MGRKKPDIREVYSFRSSSPLAWELTAVQLRFAMEVLFRRTKKDFKIQKRDPKSTKRFMSLHPVYLMVAGFMIEALIKAILLKQEKDIQKHNKHFLLSMADDARLSLNKDERELLRELTQYSRWIGRFPVPNKNTEMRITSSSNLQTHIPRVRRLADKLELQLQPFGQRGQHLRTGMRLPSGKATEKL